MTHASRSSSLTSGAAGAAQAQAAPWIERVARLGFAAKALLYVIVGVMALQAALGNGGGTMGSSGALAELLGKPFGRALLMVMALGLLGYAMWRVIEGVTDPERRGSTPKGLALRASFVVRGLVHGGLGVEAIRLAMWRRGGVSSGDDKAEHWAARALAAPFGEWLLGLVGAAFVGYGLYQLYRAYAAKLSKQLDLAALGRDAGQMAVRISRFGIGARGVVFAMIGVLLGRAALGHDASRAGGVGDALRALGNGPQGRIILCTVALGMIAYGVYECIQARYRRINAV